MGEIIKAVELVSVPVLTQNTKEIGLQIKKKIADLGIETIEATSDNLKLLKSLRASINKRFSEYEDQRKSVDRAIAEYLAPFKEAYAADIATECHDAVAMLGDKISTVEVGIKDTMKAIIKQFFDELLTLHSLYFVDFEDVGLKINLSATEKKLKEQTTVFVERIVDDLDLIEMQEFKAEMLAAYKASNDYNASRIIKDVNERKEAEKKEDAVLKAKEDSRRGREIYDISGVSFDNEFQVYSFGAETIGFDVIKEMSVDDYNSKLASIQQVCIEFKQAEKKESEAKKQANESIGTPHIQAQDVKPLSSPAISVSAPKKEEDKFTVGFVVTASLDNLKAVKALIESKKMDVSFLTEKQVSQFIK